MEAEQQREHGRGQTKSKQDLKISHNSFGAFSSQYQHQKFLFRGLPTQGSWKRTTNSGIQRRRNDKNLKFHTNHLVILGQYVSQWGKC